MSYSLRIEGGDLAIGNKRAFEVVSGKDKLFQDLKLWILERIGTDPATPLYGSTLDGGTINGSPIPSYIGQVPTPSTLNDILAEVLGLLQQYQQHQLAKMKKEMVEYNGKHTISKEEVLYTIDSVSAVAIETTVLVRVKISTLANRSFTLTLPLAV